MLFVCRLLSGLTASSSWRNDDSMELDSGVEIPFENGNKNGSNGSAAHDAPKDGT